MDKRYRAAPVTLPRNAPVPEAIIRGAFADPHFFKSPGDFILGVLDRHAIEKCRIDQMDGCLILLDQRLVGNLHVFLTATSNNRDDVQVVFPRKVQVALVVRRAAKHGALTISDKDEIGGVHR